LPAPTLRRRLTGARGTDGLGARRWRRHHHGRARHSRMDQKAEQADEHHQDRRRLQGPAEADPVCTISQHEILQQQQVDLLHRIARQALRQVPCDPLSHGQRPVMVPQRRRGVGAWRKGLGQRARARHALSGLRHRCCKGVQHRQQSIKLSAQNLLHTARLRSSTRLTPFPTLSFTRAWPARPVQGWASQVGPGWPRLAQVGPGWPCRAGLRHRRLGVTAPHSRDRRRIGDLFLHRSGNKFPHHRI